MKKIIVWIGKQLFGAVAEAFVKDCFRQFLSSSVWERIRPKVREPVEFVLCTLGCAMCIPVMAILKLVVVMQRIVIQWERIKPKARKPVVIVLCILWYIMYIPVRIILKLFVVMQRIISELER